MDFEDIVYLLLLLGSIGFGSVYQTIEDKEKKKNIGSLVGLVIILIVSDFHIAHSFITFFVNAAIILFFDKRKCHIASFTFSFLYLFFFRTTVYFGIPYPPNHTNLIQMVMVLKLVGLAFDVNRSYLAHKANSTDKTEEHRLEEKSEIINPTFTDIFHYTFNYIGILTGPFIRYRTFRDYFELPYSKYADWKKITIDKIKFVPVYAILFLIASHYWPLSYAKSDEFYNDRSILYRFWYIWPNFFIFRMRIYIGMILSECVCTVANFGAYPIFTNPKAGQGPSTNYKQQEDTLKNDKLLQTVEYSFETIHNINPFGCEFCPTFRESMKHWNMCVQYWLAINIYKRFPSKKYRTFVTMLVSAFWHGICTGHYVCLLGVPFVLPVEAVIVKLMLKGKTGTTLKMMEYLMVIVKMFFFSYLSIAFHLLTLGWVWHYYQSIYHLGIIISVLVYFGGIQVLKMQKKSNKHEEQKKE